MENENGAELMLLICVKLDEIKNLTAAVIKGLDYDIKMDTDEVRSVLNVVKRLTEEIGQEIGRYMS